MVQCKFFRSRYLELRGRTNKWVPVSAFVTGTQITVPKLTEGHQYELRVTAENAFGRCSEHRFARAYQVFFRSTPQITETDVKNIDLIC
ncbi:hypothetical protein PRIPAC_79059 [Pristionchus pacificus]|uniref:Uncharacterized protein n=1 Tax=Pristionchus pacificus TaxID=54126 RepID=A0A2A6BH87_PRIPA|nr:hypothetical protein PRIPAC_79059 [Pristionchus pacificus]|eukprot:PDM65270.1 hypothetical protein PRIPAC_52212 [Pristionchus pacificus]